MSISLLVAPGGAGKTAYALKLVRQTTTGLQHVARVCVANRQQAMSWHRRLVQGPGATGLGGCFGVEVMTFDDLYVTCLDSAGKTFTRIDETVEYRLIRAVIGQLDLAHYDALQNRPGFIQELQRLLSEFKSTRLTPRQLHDALTVLGGEARLAELVQIYEHYDALLEEQQWADYRGLGWMAVTALQDDRVSQARRWPLLVIDGFDSFTQTQIALLEQLGKRVDQLIITLTGDPHAESPRRAHRRFHRTRRELEQRLNVRAQPLPQRVESAPAGALAHLRRNLFETAATEHPDDGAVHLVEAPNPAVEVREALRWLKQRIVHDGARPHELALLARDLQSYAPFIEQTAAEFQMPVYILEGLPLAQNPCVAALLTLLRLMLPAGNGDSRQQPEEWQPALPRRSVIGALRSPYFDWRGAIGFTPTDVARLDALARQWRIVGGRKQWVEALSAAAALPEVTTPDPESGESVTSAPQGETARRLQQKFERFLQRLRPPAGKRSWREHVTWLEALLGTEEVTVPSAASGLEFSLSIVARARAGDRSDDDGRLGTAPRDIAALRMLKNILRSLLWAEESGILNRPLTYAEFVEELAGAVDATRYQPQPASEAILVAPLHQARGVPFRAVALLGLAEGAFPATLTEDPFLRESDRQRLREEHNFPLESSVASEEAEYFYEALIRPWHKLLLTRPRLAESGATWEPSPFWEEVKRLLALQPRRVESEEAPRPQTAASTAELLESLCLTEHQGALRWCDDRWPQRWRQVQRAGRLFRRRYDARETAHDGSLHELSPELQGSFGPASVWSATRLERYLTCPFYFFIGDVLHKEARVEPEVGLDARQLGSIYHRLLEQVFQNTPPHRRNDPHSLDAALDEVAPPLLDRAPRREGFRATAWWKQTRREIIANVRRSLHEMAQEADDASSQFQPTHFELRFFGSRALAVEDNNDDGFRLHGVIDRVDIDEQGQVRIIDYKTAGPYRYGASALRQGRKIQLPLYALAAEKALQLGRVVDGFYWHVQHAERSSLRLADMGPEEAIQLAHDHAWRAVRGVRAGDFRPEPPSEGCPTYCPAAAFCWHYSPPRSW